MGTAKRERKKNNRQIRLEELEKQRRRQKARRRFLQLGIVIPAAIIALVLIVWTVNSKSDSKSSSTTVATDVTDTSVDTTDSTPTTDSTVPASTLAPLPCPKDDGSSVHESTFPSAPPMCIDTTKVYVATITTNKGEFTVELDPGIAPKTVNNFVYLANYHFFDNSSCWRIIPGFMVQCGDPTGKGNGNPGYHFADELPAAGAYKLGSVAMANNASPDTNGSQFFIITGEAGTGLGPSYSLFGQVATGYDTTVKTMEALGTTSGKPSTEVTIQKVVISVKPGAVATATTTTTTTAATTTAAPATTAN